MKKTFAAAFGALIALGVHSTVAMADGDAGQPGYYGRIDVGDGPRPKLIYAKPVLIKGRQTRQAPVYLHVRPGHARNWKKHCAEYKACGQRVYFVNDKWYETTYVDHHRRRHGDDRSEGRRDEGHDDQHAHEDHHGADDRAQPQGNNGRGYDNDRGQGNGKFDN